MVAHGAGGHRERAAGLVTFGWPVITAVILLYVIAFWAVVTGGLQDRLDHPESPPLLPGDWSMG